LHAVVIGIGNIDIPPAIYSNTKGDIKLPVAPASATELPGVGKTFERQPVPVALMW